MTDTEKLNLALEALVILLRQHYVFGGVRPGRAIELVAKMEAALEKGE